MSLCDAGSLTSPSLKASIMRRLEDDDPAILAALASKQGLGLLTSSCQGGTLLGHLLPVFLRWRGNLPRDAARSATAAASVLTLAGEAFDAQGSNAVLVTTTLMFLACFPNDAGIRGSKHLSAEDRAALALLWSTAVNGAVCQLMRRGSTFAVLGWSPSLLDWEGL
jgi:hypothetical protein